MAQKPEHRYDGTNLSFHINHEIQAKTSLHTYTQQYPELGCSYRPQSEQMEFWPH